MKHQYFADITDYKKYSLLRFINERISGTILTAWMLTPDDGSNDGRHTGYLSQPEQYAHFEPDIFESLQRHTADNNRSVEVVDSEQYVPNMTCFAETLLDNPTEREKYMRKTRELARDHEVVFFDPDNGMETKSTPYGKRGSSKYLYWNELQNAYAQGQSILVYQHFARVKREPFINAHAEKMLALTGACTVASIETSWVAFFLILQPRHEKSLATTWHELEQKWGPTHMKARVHGVLQKRGGSER